MEFSDVVALKIKELMKEKNASIYKLETLTGVYSSTITLFLNRKTKTIRLENLLYICEALGTNLSEFLLMKDLMKQRLKTGLKKIKKSNRIKFITFLFLYFLYIKHLKKL